MTRAGTPPRPPGTPDDVVLAWEPRVPIPLEESDLGIDVAPVAVGTTPPHRLVTIGDSITHGFKSFAISDTAWSWPAILARTIGIDDFRFAIYPGPEKCPGLPLNLEAAIRSLDQHVPGSLADVVSDVDVVVRLRSLMDEVEDYWERKEGRKLIDSMPGEGPVNHNLAVWGFDLRDALSKSVAYCQDAIEHAPNKGDGLIKQIPSAAGERSALPVLAGGTPDDTLVSLAKRLGGEGTGGGPGIETLVVALGANNALGTVINFSVQWSTDATFQDLKAKSASNLWAPTHFKIELDALVEQISEIQAQHVLWLTVPHVTIAPMLRGVGNAKMSAGSRYYARYTRPWIRDDEFHANRHPCLPGDMARVVDSVIDQYNDMIVEQVRVARSNGRDWRVLDIAGILDRLAHRRYVLDDQAQPSWWHPYELPEAYQHLSPLPDTRFYVSDKFGRTQGGLFALDGIHPTSIGYGIIAYEVLQVVRAFGVATQRTAVDFDALIEHDTLITSPPTRFANLWTFASLANRTIDFAQALRHKPPI